MQLHFIILVLNPSPCLLSRQTLNWNGKFEVGREEVVGTGIHGFVWLSDCHLCYARNFSNLCKKKEYLYHMLAIAHFLKVIWFTNRTISEHCKHRFFSGLLDYQNTKALKIKNKNYLIGHKTTCKFSATCTIFVLCYQSSFLNIFFLTLYSVLLLGFHKRWPTGPPK